MLPVTDEYIAGEFLVDNSHYISKDKNLVRQLSVKARNYIKQLELGRMRSQVDALDIREKLIAKSSGV
jgi:hypothetical protein